MVTGVDPLDGKARAAAGAWARTVFGAPRAFPSLIRTVDKADETIERVACQVVRRTLTRVVAPTSERINRAPRHDPNTLDPFAFTSESLRVGTDHVVSCEECAGSGTTACPRCRGSGQIRCSQCGGAGSFRNPSTNRMNQCKPCKQTGRVSCIPCGGDGRATCATCRGSGHKCAWLTFEDVLRWDISHTSSPTVVAHRQLAEPRPLQETDLQAFAVDAFVASAGPLLLAQLPTNRAMVDAQLAKLDRRFERVVSQQYVRIAVQRRDVTYRMCGTTGVLVLSGNELAPASTREAVRPIKRRLWWTLGLASVLGVTLAATVIAFAGASDYFASARRVSAAACAGALALSIPWLLGSLRAWGATNNKTTRVEKISGAASLVALITGIATLLFVRPSIAEADGALAAKDIARARTVLAALQEQHGEPGAVRDLEDRILMAEVSNARGDDRLKLLDAVSSHAGAAAKGAAVQARAERLQVIRDANATKRSTDALAAVDRWFPRTVDPEVLEEAARAHDAVAAGCAKVPCRLREVMKAFEAHPSASRTSSLAAARAELEGALTPPSPAPAEVLARLVVAHELEATATDALGGPLPAETRTRAEAALGWVKAERAKVALIGATLEVVEQVIGPVQRVAPDRAMAKLEGGLEAYFAFDRGGRCTGMYVVGTKEQSRLFTSSVWSSQRLVAQAIGRPVQTQITAPKGGVMRWSEGGRPVTARFHDSSLVELRIGQAAP